MVERVVSQTELDTPDPSLIQQMRRLQLSHLTGQRPCLEYVTQANLGIMM